MCVVDELSRVKDTAEKQKAQIQEGAQRESILVLRLTAKEQEVQEFMVSVFFDFFGRMYLD